MHTFFWLVAAYAHLSLAGGCLCTNCPAKCSLSTTSVRSSRRHCNSGVKDRVAVPPVGTRVSFFERSLLGPNSARLLPGPEGNIITQLIPVQRSSRVFPGPGKGQLIRRLFRCGYIAVPSIRRLRAQSCACCPTYITYCAFTMSFLYTAVCSLYAAPVQSSRRHCTCGVKGGVTAPPTGTQVSFFEHFLNFQLPYHGVNHTNVTSVIKYTHNASLN